MRKVIFFFAIFSYLLSFAQATTVVVDNQTPGWLSSKINYGDQQTVENLTVTGYINSEDLKFIGTLIQKYNLHKSLDISDVNIIGDATNKDNEISYDNIFGLLSKEPINLLALPKSIASPIPHYSNAPLKNLTVDTLIYGSENCSTYNNSLWGYISSGGSGAKSAPRHLILREGVTTIAKSACDNIKITSNNLPIEIVVFPNTLKTIEEGAFRACPLLSEIILPNNIETIEADAFIDTNILPDTLRLPLSLSSFYTTAFPLLSGQVVIVPATTTSINNTYRTYNNTFNTWYTHDYISSSHKYIFIMNSTEPPTFNYNSTSCLKGSTVFIPEGSYSNYASKSPYKESNLVEIINVTGVYLNESNVEITEDGSIKLIATVVPENATNRKVNWTSSDTSVAIVSEDGVVYGLKEGSATVSASSTDNTNVKAECVITVKKDLGVEDIYVDKDTTLKVYDLTGTLIYEGMFADLKLKPGFYIFVTDSQIVKVFIK